MTLTVAAPADYGRELARYRRLGLLLIGLFVVCFGGWGGFVPLSSAVVAVGRLEVIGDIKRIQHEQGGIITEIAVKEGQKVKAGELLIALDDTVPRASLEITDGKLSELLSREARLRAERDGATEISFPETLLARKDEPVIAALIASETKQFEERRLAREGQKSQLQSRITQLEAQVAGTRKKDAAKAQELELARGDLDRARKLVAKGAIADSKTSLLEQQVAQLEGQKGQIEADLGELGARIAETNLQLINVDQTAAAQASADLTTTEADITEYRQRLLAAGQNLKNMKLVSPVDGVVHQLAVHTIGGVARAGDVLMTIVPSGEALMISVRVSPGDIDAVTAGQVAEVQFPGLNRSTTPRLEATVTRVGADLVEDPQGRTAYYPVDMMLAPGEASRIKDVELVAGMPVETYLLGPKRTFFSYLMKPILDRMNHAIRE